MPRLQEPRGHPGQDPGDLDRALTARSGEPWLCLLGDRFGGRDMLSLKHQPTSILFWIQGPMALACAANWRRRRSLACWRASSSCNDWSRMGTSCFTCQDSRTMGVRGQRWSRRSGQDRWWWVEGRGGSRVGGEQKRRRERGRKRSVPPTSGTKGGAQSSLDCQPVPPAC